MTSKPDRYIYSSEAARILGISVRTLTNWVKQGELNCLRRGKNRLFSLSELESFQQNSFYRRRKPKLTLIYINPETKLERSRLVRKAERYCRQRDWKTVVVCESISNNQGLRSRPFQTAFNYFFEQKLERLICCKNRDESSKILSTLVESKGLEILDLLELES